MGSPHGATHVDLATIENQIAIGRNRTLVFRTHCCANGVGNCLRFAGHACGPSTAAPLVGGGSAAIEFLGFVGLSETLSLILQKGCSQNKRAEFQKWSPALRGC